jgi:hypothetical protein
MWDTKYWYCNTYFRVKGWHYGMAVMCLHVYCFVLHLSLIANWTHVFSVNEMVSHYTQHAWISKHCWLHQLPHALYCIHAWQYCNMCPLQRNECVSDHKYKGASELKFSRTWPTLGKISVWGMFQDSKGGKVESGRRKTAHEGWVQTSSYR